METICAVCGAVTTGEVYYVPLTGAVYPVCSVCSWQVGNFADMARALGRPPTYRESAKRLGTLAAVLPGNHRHYRELLRFYKKTHPE